MGSEYQPHSSSSGTIIAIVVAVALLALCGFLVLVGVVFFVRLSPPKGGWAVPPQVTVEDAAVAVEPEEAVLLPSARPAPPTADVPYAAARVRKVSIRLDQQGDIVADGEPVDRDELQELLEEAREDGQVHLEVLIEVHSQCVYQHVAAVQAVCLEAGVRDMQLRTLKSTSDSH